MQETTKNDIPPSTQDVEHSSGEDEIDTVILDAIIRAIQNKTGATTERPYLLTISDSPSGYESLSDQLYLKLKQASVAIDFLIDLLLDVSYDLPPIKAVAACLPEIDSLFELGKEQIRKEGKAFIKSTDEERKKAFHSIFDQNVHRFEHLKKKYLSKNCFKWTEGQEKRSFRDKVMHNILDDKNLPTKNIRNLINTILQKQA